jgi:hypothetical protein
MPAERLAVWETGKSESIKPAVKEAINTVLTP